MAATNRVHYFHADASAVGGYLERPVERVVPLQAPLSLSPAGGYGAANAEPFQLEGILSFEAASTQVAGNLSKKEGHGWTTLVTSTLERLNVLDVVTADRVVAQISTEHPLVGYDPTVTFLGTQFENLKIGGRPVEVILNLDICNQGNGGGYPNRPCVADEQFLARVAEQNRRITEPQSTPKSSKQKPVLGWIMERYHQDNPQAGKKGSVLCSVVTETSGEFGGRSFGHVLDVPDFGRVFLGELIVDSSSYQLTMVRLELGCIAHGNITACACRANGSTAPWTGWY
jgi:hypothetical protein